MRHSWESPEEKIRRLEDELFVARETILGLLPDKLYSLRDSYCNCKSREEASQWLETVIEKLLTHVDTDPFDLRQDRTRICCPLCRSGTKDDEKGFAIPEGLRRHFTGYGNIRKCPVLEQLNKLAREYWNEMFAKQEQFEKEKSKVLLEAQGEGAPLYLVEPDAIPKLLSEIYFSGDKKQLKLAEARLQDLGVEKKVDGRIVSYIYDDGEVRIYANPFELNKIEFRAYKIPLKSNSNKCYHSYILYNYYKNGLKDKFEKFVREAKTKIE